VLRATVEHVEWLGHETLAHVRLGADEAGLRLVARLGGMRPLARGAAVRLRLPARRLHVFASDGSVVAQPG
jgi:hypothetical protein